MCFCDMYSADVSESQNPWPMAAMAGPEKQSSSYHVSALSSSDDAWRRKPAEQQTKAMEKVGHWISTTKGIDW
jgi:hypothetical protein